VTRPPVVDQRASASRARLPAVIGWVAVAPPAVSAAARVARLDESSTLLILADCWRSGSGCGSAAGR
jgi:hypothetical protein